MRPNDLDDLSPLEPDDVLLSRVRRGASRSDAGAAGNSWSRVRRAWSCWRSRSASR